MKHAGPMVLFAGLLILCFNHVSHIVPASAVQLSRIAPARPVEAPEAETPPAAKAGSAGAKAVEGQAGPDSSTDVSADSAVLQDSDPATAAAGGSAGEELMVKYNCMTCHSLEKDKKLLGPSLFGVGDRLDAPGLYESIMRPDAKLVEGFQAGLMIATLNAAEFYTRVTGGELKTIVVFLAAQKGGPE